MFLQALQCIVYRQPFLPFSCLHLNVLPNRLCTNVLKAWCSHCTASEPESLFFAPLCPGSRKTYIFCKLFLPFSEEVAWTKRGSRKLRWTLKRKKWNFLHLFPRLIWPTICQSMKLQNTIVWRKQKLICKLKKEKNIGINWKRYKYRNKLEKDKKYRNKLEKYIKIEINLK